MKRILWMVAVMLMALPSYSQHTERVKTELSEFEKQKVESRREYYGNIPENMTKVVISGDNSMTDLLFQNAVKNGWSVSPFEFCSMEEFERIKCDTNYYFLLRINSSRKEEDPSMQFMTYVKGNENAGEGITAMPEVLSLPIIPESDQEGRIYSYLPAYVSIFQSYLQNVSDGEFYPSFYKVVHTLPMEDAVGKTILFREDDFSEPVTQEMLEKQFYGLARLATQEEIDRAIKNGDPDTLVSLVVSNSEPVKGAMCYKMLISTDTYELYFYRKHKLSKKRPAGFVRDDLRRMSAPYETEYGRI